MFPEGLQTITASERLEMIEARKIFFLFKGLAGEAIAFVDALLQGLIAIGSLIDQGGESIEIFYGVDIDTVRRIGGMNDHHFVGDLAGRLDIPFEDGDQPPEEDADYGNGGKGQGEEIIPDDCQEGRLVFRGQPVAEKKKQTDEDGYKTEG